MSDIVKGLREERGRIWEQMKALLDKAKEEGRDLTAEEDATFGKMNEDLDRKDTRIKAVTDAEEREADLSARRQRLDIVPKAGPVAGRSSEEDLVTAFLKGEKRHITLTLPRPERVLNITDNVQGEQNIVPTTFVRKLYEYLTEESIIRQLPVWMVPTASGEPMEFPKVTANTGAAQIVGEGDEFDEQEPTFDQVILNAYKYGFLRLLSSEFMQDEAVNVLGFLARDGARAIALGTDAHFWNGTGTDQPNGIIPNATVGVTGADTVPTGDELIDLVGSVIPSYRRKARFVLNDTSLTAIRKLTDMNGQYLWVPGLQAGAADRLLGYPVLSDPNIPEAGAGARSIVFGAFDAYLIREVGQLEVARSDHYAFNRDLVAIRYRIRVDGDLIDTTGALKVFVGGGYS